MKLVCVAAGVLAFGIAPALAAEMAPGSYECWANGEARLMMNFSVVGPGAYTDFEGNAGGYSMDAGGNVSFSGAGLDGVLPEGWSFVYRETPRPTLDAMSARGVQAAFCENVG